MLHSRTVASIFHWVGGGGAYLKNRPDQLINVGMIRGNASAGDTRFLEDLGNASPEKFYHHHVILFHFESFAMPSGGHFWLLVGDACAPHTRPPAFAPGLYILIGEYLRQK